MEEPKWKPIEEERVGMEAVKNVISYPSECIPDTDLEVTMLIRPLV